MHVVEGRPRKDAIITVLEPRSSYGPWHADDFQPIKEGDRVIAIIDTDPVSVLGEPDAGTHQITGPGQTHTEVADLLDRAINAG